MVYRFRVALICLVIAIAVSGCGRKDSGTNATGRNSSLSVANEVEKVKPAPGTGNVQGKVLFNSAPVENIEVKLCETFSRFLSGCGGKMYTARTDKDGDFVITNVEPKEYQALTVRVFDTDSYVFATTGFGVNAAKYNVAADKTLFVSPTHIFKGDLKTVNPRAGAAVNAQDLELKWDAYPEAGYYKFSIYPNDTSKEAIYVNERVDGTTFKVAKPIEKGSYRWQVEAFNSADKKISESPDGMNFTVN